MTDDQDSREEKQERKTGPPSARSVPELLSSFRPEAILGTRANALLGITPAMTKAVDDFCVAVGYKFSPISRQIDAIVRAAHIPVTFNPPYELPVTERPMPRLAGYARKRGPKDIEIAKLKARIEALEADRDYWRDAYIGAVPVVEERSRDSK